MRSFCLQTRLPALSSLKIALLAMILMLQTLAAAQSPDYVLGPEDVFTVTVLKHPEFSGEFLVPTEGIVALPAIGQVKVAGMTLTQLTDHVRKGLSKRLLKPEVAVALKLARPMRISVLGNVNKAGTYDIKTGWRITEALGAAGGLPEGVRMTDFRVSLLRANTNERVAVNLDEALKGNPEYNFEIKPGDVLNVEVVEPLPVYVMGKVKTPGVYKLPPDSAGPMEAIAMAGGLLSEAAASKVKVIRLDGKEETIDLTPIILRGEKMQLPKLASGDLVVVPESDQKVAVLGLVQQPGIIPMPDGKVMTLNDALAIAKYDNKRASLKKIGIVRLENGKEKRMEFDYGRFRDKADMTQNPVLKTGDVIFVPETNKIDWNALQPGVTLAALLFRLFGG